MLKKKLLTIVSLTSAGFLPLAQADEPFLDDRFYIAPFGSFVKSGGDRNASDGWGGGMGFGKIIDQHFNVEVKGFHEGFGPWSMSGGTADMQYFFVRDKLSPYAVVGLGGMNSCASVDCGVGFIGEAGAGLTYELHDNFLLRSDVRYRYNNNLNAQVQPGTDEFHDMTVNVGFVIPFGAKPESTRTSDLLPPPMAAAPIDDCSTRDADTDGVNDCLDQCPGSIQGSKVDAHGCLIRLVLKGVNFKYDSAELTPSAMGILDGVVESLLAYPQKNDIEVQGHASSEGTDRYNMKLSQRRSESVVEYLKTKGVTNSLIAHGYGETQPIADNSTEAGRSENRRIELIWIGD